MVEIRLTQVQAKVLMGLSEVTEPIRASNLMEVTGEPAMVIGKTLRELEKLHLSDFVDKRQGLWQISNTGKEVVATLQVPVKAAGQTPPKMTPPQESPIGQPIGQPIRPPIGGPEVRATVRTEEATTVQPTPEVPPTQPEGAPQIIVPSKATILREIGERLGIRSDTTKKGEGATLDAIIYFVERTADMDNLTQVWNSVTQMGVPAHIIKRWITLYAQTLTDKQIPEELKERLDTISEKGTVTITEKGEVAPKPKRFSVVAGQIVGDPEGDYDFNQAFKIWAQEKAVPANQADPLGIALEAMVTASKEGPQTALAVLTAMTPFLTKEPPKHDDSPLMTFITAQQAASQLQVQSLQQMLLSATGEKYKAEVEGIKAMITTSQKPPESNQQMQALTEQINSLRESLHQQQITTIQEQNKTMIERMESQITRLETQITAAAQGKAVDSKIGLIDKTLDKGAQELSGVRQDIKGFAQMILAKGEPLPRPRSAQEKQRFGTGMEKGIENAQEAKRLADKLWFPPKS